MVPNQGSDADETIGQTSWLQECSRHLEWLLLKLDGYVPLDGYQRLCNALQKYATGSAALLD